MSNEIKSHVLSIIDDIENGRQYESCIECGADLNKSLSCPECEADNPEIMSGLDYISDVLDINWILNSDRTFRGARLLVAFGGPTIWVDTTTANVEGYWWGDSFTASYRHDEMDIQGACSELFNC